MELRQLRYFLAVAEELHFGRAARRLHMSQPPLSVQVARLEQEVGTALFDRSTRRVALTPAGRHLQARARHIVEELDTVRGEMRDFVDGLAGELTAGFVSSANYTVLPGVVQLFRASRPGVTLRLVPLTSGEQFDRLRDGTLDVGIVRDEVPQTPSDTSPALTTEVVFEERLVACLPVGHPLAGRPEVTAEELMEVPMISYPRALMPGFVDRVAEVLGTSSRTQVVEEVVHQETALGFVAAGVGTTILPESVRQLVPPSIVVVPLAGSPTTRLLAARQERTDESPVHDAFIACLRDAAAQIG
ncbi:LysR family transcriptional regulator [Plantibacter sp. CFBP 13570]|uniref:LysR family transcriptional regulator n=1 Tax=Plantibacter sp. CFBP 13570 TaxID=2775272 RepID=UPI001930CD81|nr:LysR substrate-binding domain-containing protein [Plantibacter sp. CFBP 13570]MBD8533979.1 LysR family transcriptional regulator [Plantibacter sp. CFBP 13570]